VTTLAPWAYTGTTANGPTPTGRGSGLHLGRLSEATRIGHLREPHDLGDGGAPFIVCPIRSRGTMTMWLLTEPRAADMDNPEPGALCRPRRGRSATVIVLKQFGQTPAGIGKADIVFALDKYPSAACGVE
jgi:hypothetical protein